MENSEMIRKNKRKSLEFQIRILERFGLSEETCLAPGFHYIPPKITMEDAKVEAELWTVKRDVVLGFREKRVFLEAVG
ncbi:hypothetical protein L1987_70914 [Smallanthus sonchifolius]|uniref:Uncharacterized protein n=1 Tax=Smallanthus sonchifolius TaxID=185202 RepID=A0ACB9AVA3_9ASTR|nr:hypothetical protein L1987_70914 [Smallanthus sonchifolius]